MDLKDVTLVVADIQIGVEVESLDHVAFIFEEIE